MLKWAQFKDKCCKKKYVQIVKGDKKAEMFISRPIGNFYFKTRSTSIF